MIGTIKALKKAQPGQPRKGSGYGFITDTAGADRFFQHGDVDGDFDGLQAGLTVEFDPQDNPRGLRATSVRVISQ